MENIKDFKNLNYEKPNFDKVSEELLSLTNGAKNAKDFEELKTIIKEFEDFYGKLHTDLSIAMIRAYLDSSDEYYNSEMQDGMQKEATLNYNDFYDSLLNSPFKEDIDKEFGKQFLIKLSDTISLKSKGTELIEKEQELIFKYQNLKATLRIEFKGESLSEGQIRKYMTNEDRDVRREATDLLNKAYLEKKEEFSNILNELVEVRNKIAKANGFSSFADYMNLEKGRRDYGQKELLQFVTNIKEELKDIMMKLSENQAKRLGLEKLAYYDQGISFIDGNAKPVGGGEVLLEKAKAMYKDLGEDISKLYNEMVDKNYIDVNQSPNKISGIGFCTQIYTLRFPYIFGNCNGTIHDVDVLTHELGHAYQMYLSLKNHELYAYSDMPNDVVEIPSKAMEHFTQDYAELFFGEDTNKFKFQFLSKALNELIAYSTIHEFESWLYENEDVSLEERARKYFEGVKAMDPGVDYSEIDEIEAGMGLLFRSMGVYMFPFYLISYAISAISAMEIAKRRSENKEKAWEDYKNLCAVGGSLSYNELLKTANLSSPFEKETIKNSIGFIKGKLEKYLD